MGELIESVSVAPPWLWTFFSIAVFLLLLIDLSLFGKQNQSKKTALIESGLWIGIALIFNLWFAHQYGKELGVQFLTGYLVEKSLSVDNLFIILLIFTSFKIPEKYQHKILFLGVLGAIVLRAFFIIAGAQLLHKFSWLLYVFGAVLIITGIKLLRDCDTDSDIKDNWFLKRVRKAVPSTAELHGDKLFVKENGLRKVTPLFFALVAIEFTDIVFAVDSIPAIFSITQDAFVAFASNIFAILGLRALYFVLADWVSKLRYLKPGLATVLGFIGAKMMFVDVLHIPSWVSLIVISFILTTAALCSWYVNRREVVNS